MKNIFPLIFIILTIIFIIVAGIIFLSSGRNNVNINIDVNKNLKNNMKITSPVFENNQKIPPKYTCDGEDINPPLEISEVPENAKSLVLIMDDPDAIKPAGKVWDHWLVWNIPASTRKILEGQEPEGIHGKGTSGNKKYQGPCPPDAEHRYFFKVYALDIMLDIPEGSPKSILEKAMENHVIDKGELIGRYQR
jgi:hypothetical protein